MTQFFSQVVSLCVRSNLLEGKGVEVEEDCTAHERKGKRLKQSKMPVDPSTKNTPE